ncbi:MAG: sodium:calcium antiporter [Candidatus Limnocylindrales bacterium]
MLASLVVLLVAFGVILLGSWLFADGIEWFGHKLGLAEGAVGSILAAIGTALPETMIPLVAILLGGSAASDEVGIGAILGAPFMLATLAMAVTGLVVLAARARRTSGEQLDVDTRVLGEDVRYFAVAYGLAIAVAFAPIGWSFARPAAAIALIGLYLFYVRAHLAAETAAGKAEDLRPLRFHRLDRHGRRLDPVVPRLRIVGLQVLAAMACTVGGAYIFVHALSDLAAGLGVGPALLALVIAPLATELPENINSFIWITRGKDTLALGNITGAMVFQSCVPTVVALALAPDHWVAGPGSQLVFLSAFVAFAATGAIFLPMARRARLVGRGLLVGGLFYAAYLAVVVLGLVRG